ncbi:MAG: patatin, partial [Propionibacterium sp.]
PWLGLPFLNRTPEPKTECLVLSGGGSRACFQLGALTYLYDEVGIAPTLFSGTSAGSMLAAGLAQSADPSQQREILSNLTEIWFAQKQQSDMFTPQPWFELLQERAPEWLGLMRPAEVPSWLPWQRETPEPHPAKPTAAELRKLAGKPLPETTDWQWTPALAMQLMSILPRAGKIGGDLGRILSGADATRSMYRPGPMLAQLLDPEVFDPNRVASAGTELRIAFVGLGSGELRYMRQDGRLTDRDNELVSNEQFNLADGVHASCSIPAVFPPVQIGDDWYIDGGVRENLPAEIAIGHLKADRTWVIVCAPAGVEPETGYDERGLPAIAARTTSILTDESLRDEVAYARTAGAFVIEPEVNVHDAITVEPALIRINYDYGWMRAALVQSQGMGEHNDTVNRIISCRIAAWKVENRPETDWEELR